MLLVGGSLPAVAETVTVSNDRLEVALTLPDGLLSVYDRRSGVRWKQALPTKQVRNGRTWDKIRVVPVDRSRRVRIERAAVRGQAIDAEATWRGEPYRIRFVLLNEQGALRVTIDRVNRSAPFPGKLDWWGGLMTYPYAFYSERAAPYSVVPVDEGLIYSTRETTTRDDPVRWRYGRLHQRLSMPWYGVTDFCRGVMTRIDTPFDALFSVEWVDTPWGERTLPQVTWAVSQGRWGYARSVTYRFFAEGGYTAMAKAFRNEMIGCGLFRTWTDKVRDNPNVARLRGAVDLWYHGRIDAQLIRALQQAGIRRAIVSRSGGGRPTPGDGIASEALVAAEQAGFLIGMYHNYTWIQGRWVDREPGLKKAAALPASGELHYRPNGFDPKGNLIRCPAAYSQEFAISRAERKLGLTYFFTDCTTAGESITECFDADHRVARRDAARLLRSALDTVSRGGMVVGSERGTWWATPSVHVFEGIETILEYAGPYRGKSGAAHWEGPYLQEKRGYRELFLGVEFNPSVHVPLFQLVYHDSVYCTRRWNQDPVRAPELWDRHDLMNVINGTSSLWNMRPGSKNVIGTSEWERVKERYLRTYRQVCGWHAKIGFDELQQHRFLSADRLVQQSRFSSGWTVVVNFGDRVWEDPRGFEVKPGSFHPFRE